MAYSAYQDRHSQPQLPWSDLEIQDEYLQSQYVLPGMPVDRFSGQRPDVMERYFQQRDRQLLKAIASEPDFAMHPHPETPANLMEPADSDGPFYSYRYSSPATSGQSSYISSNMSDGEPTTWPSPESMSYSPDLVYCEPAMHTGDHAYYSGHCVALHEVQAYADTQPEKFTFEKDDHLHYGTMIQEGYQPISPHAHHDLDTVISCGTEHSIEAPLEQDQVIRRRRAPSQRSSLPTSCSPARVSKRTSTPKRPKLSAKSSTQNTTPAPHLFPCPFAQYGCLSEFGSKNEWKRHALTQHMRLGFWRCDQCPQLDRKPNDFNRKDLFTQHVRRMHRQPSPTNPTASSTSKTRPPSKVEEADLASAAIRCYRPLRARPKQSGCTFCPMHFTDWDERMEHVGQHLDGAKKPGRPRGSIKDIPALDDALQWRCDEDTEKWLLDENLLVRVGGKLVFTDARRV